MSNLNINISYDDNEVCFYEIIDELNKIKKHYQSLIKNSYINSCIYRIQVGNEFYIGSTKDFKARITAHLSSINDKNNTVKLYKAIRDNNYNYKIIKMWRFPCENEKELCDEEQRAIRNYKPTLNMVNAVNDYESKILTREKQKIKNREIITCECGLHIQRSKLGKHKKTNYHNRRLEQIKLYGRAFSPTEQQLKKKLLIELDKATIKIRLKIREKQKILCECGCFVLMLKKNKHDKTNKHIENINNCIPRYA